MSSLVGGAANRVQRALATMTRSAGQQQEREEQQGQEEVSSRPPGSRAAAPAAAAPGTQLPAPLSVTVLERRATTKPSDLQKMMCRVSMLPQGRSEHLAGLATLLLPPLQSCAHGLPPSRRSALLRLAPSPCRRGGARH